MLRSWSQVRQIFDYANRANPWPLWARLRETPVCWQEDGPEERGTYVVSTKRPGDDMLSRMATERDPGGRMSDQQPVATGVLLLIAGHETTVHLLGNGMLALLRHPTAFERLRDAPQLIPAAVEEMLRYDGPVQFLRQRTTLDKISLAGTTIPKGVLVTLALAAGNRDPARFPDPNRFDPERRDNQHLGFGSGIHSCFGAPLVRIEAQIAFPELLRRLEQPRLVVVPPPYRPSLLLRGPEHLLIEVASVQSSEKPLVELAQR